MNWKDCVARYPSALLSDKKVRALLSDLYMNDQLRINLMMNAYHIGIIDEMRKSYPVDQFTITRWCRKLVSYFGVSDDYARWAIDTWTKAITEDVLRDLVKAEKQDDAELADFVLKDEKYKENTAFLERLEKSNDPADWFYYKELAAEFAALGNYRDSESLSTKAQETARKMVRYLYNTGFSMIRRAQNPEENNAGFAIIEPLRGEIPIDKAISEYERRKVTFEKIIRFKKKLKRWAAIVLPAAAVVLVVVSVLYIQARIREQKYTDAVQWMERGQYAKAIEAFRDLGDYEDSKKYILHCELETIEAASMGDYVNYGLYEQDADSSNGQEYIEWLVLEKRGNKVLLLSRYGLDVKPYNTTGEETTWENCSLRQWLNNEFFNQAFTPEEKTVVIEANVNNSQAQGWQEWHADGGNNTQDKVFLLSYGEVHRYLNVQHSSRAGAGENEKSRVTPTVYAIQNGAYTSVENLTENGEAAGWWLLRSPGTGQTFSAIVSEDGSLRYYLVGNSAACVRPAVWISLDADAS